MNTDYREEMSLIYNNLNENVFDFELKNFSDSYIIKNKLALPKLYRYSDADYYNIRGLETQTLFLREIGSMNDIFEGLTCETDNNILGNIDDMKDLAYLKSFSETYKNNLMWAHYANNSKGICIEYDFSNLANEILYHLFPVCYTDKKFRDINLQDILMEHRDLKQMNYEKNGANETDCLKEIMSLFLVKSIDWSYEKEWRLMVTYPQLNNCANDIVDEYHEFYDVNSQTINVENCIKSVYLGSRIEPIKRTHIIEICKKLGIEIYKSFPSTKTYEFEFIKI